VQDRDHNGWWGRGERIYIFLHIFIYLLRLGCYPVAVVILQVKKHEIGTKHEIVSLHVLNNWVMSVFEFYGSQQSVVKAVASTAMKTGARRSS